MNGKLVGVVTPSLVRKLQADNVDTTRSLRQEPKAFTTHVATIPQHATMGEMADLLKNVDYVVVTSEYFIRENGVTQKKFHILGLGSMPVLLKWVFATERHHENETRLRQQRLAQGLEDSDGVSLVGK